MTRLQTQNNLLNNPSDDQEWLDNGYFNRVMDQMAEDQPIRAEDLSDDQLSRFHTKFPSARKGRTEREIRELAAHHFNNPFGVVGTPPEESLGTSMKLAPGRFIGGVRRGALVEPSAMISSGFATLAEVYGNPDLAQEFRRNADRIRFQDNATTIGQLSQDDSLVASAGNVIGNVAPGAISLVASGGASGPILFYYGLQAFGGGAEDYRSTLELNGVEPNAISELQFAMGYAAVEVVTEKMGLDLIGNVGTRAARKIGDAMLSGNKRTAAAAIANLTTGATINGVEESLAEIGQNALASKGTFFSEGFDPNRGLLEGVPQAFATGAFGGSVLTSASLFSPRGRESLRDTKQQLLSRSPLTQEEIEVARKEALQNMQPSRRVIELTEEQQQELQQREQASDIPVLSEQEQQQIELFDFPPEHLTLDEQDQADLVQFAETMATSGVDPDTGYTLTNSERRRAIAVTEAIKSDAVLETIQTQDTESEQDIEPEAADAQEVRPVREQAETQGQEPQQRTRDLPVEQRGQREEAAEAQEQGEVIQSQETQDATQRPEEETEEAQVAEEEGQAQEAEEVGEPQQRLTLVDRLQSAEDNALNRIRTRRRPSDVPRDAQGRPRGGARGGSAPIFNDIADATIALVARSVRTGVTSASQIRQVVRDFVAIEAEHLEPHIERIVRNIRTILARSTANDAIDDERLELEITRIRQEAARRDRRSADTIKSQIRRHVQGEQSRPTVTEEQALRERLRGEQRAAKAASIEEQRQQESRFREMITDIRRRAQAEQARLRQEGRKGAQEARREATERGRARAREVQQLKDELANVARQLLPPEIRGNVLTDIRDVKTLQSLSKSTRKVLKLRNEFMRKQEIANLKSVLNDFDIDKLRPEFKREMKGLIGDLSLTKMNESTELKLRGLQRFLDSSPSAVVPSAVEGQLRRLEQKPIDKLTRDEAKALSDSVKHVLHLNKMKNRLIRNGRLRELNELAGEVASEAEQHIQTGSFIPLKGEDELLKPDTIAEWWGGGEDSTTWQVLYNDLRIGQREWLRGHQQFTDKFLAIMNRHGFDPSSKDTARLSNVLAQNYGKLESFLRRDQSLAGETKAELRSVTLESGETIELTPDEMMYIMASVADRETHDLIVFDGVPIRVVRDDTRSQHTLTGADIATIEQRLSSRERSMVHDVVQLMNTDLTEEIRGWSVDTRGYDITKEDTWFPRHRDHTEEVGAFDSARFSQGLLTSASIVQRRTGGGEPIQVRSFFGEVHNVSWQTHAISRMSPSVANARKILDSEMVKTATNNRSDIRRHFIRVLDELAREAVGGPSMQGTTERRVARLIDNTQVGILGANPRVMFYQPASILVAASEMRESDLMRSFATGSGLNTEIDARMKKHSPVLRARFENSALGLMSEAGDSRRRRAILGLSGEKTKVRAVGEWMMKGIQFFDRIAIRTIWRASEIEIRRERPELQGDAYWSAVADRAERVVQRTQPVFDTLHLSGVGLAARKNSFLRASTMFFSQRNQNINIAARNTLRVARSDTRKNRALAGKNIGYALVGNSLFVAAIQSMFSLIDPDDDEDRFKDFFRNWLKSTSSNIYFGDYLFSYPIDRAFGERGFQPNAPVFDLLFDVTKGGVNVVERAIESDPRFWKSLLELSRDVGTLSGLPISAPYRLIEDAIKRITDDESDRVAGDPVL